MKKIWAFLKNHIKEDFNPKLYGLTAGFLVLAITLNYTFEFEDSYLETLNGYPKFFAYLLFYSLPYFTIVHFYAATQKRTAIYFQVEFWIKSLFGLTILSLDASVPFLQTLIASVFHPKMQFWTYKVAINTVSLVTVFIPILVFYFVFDRHQHNIYGLTARRFDVKPYFAMLLIMLPLIIGASFNEAFLRQYPMYKTSSAFLYLGVPEWVTVAIYETVYGLDFITVEFLFRGFFVIAMTAILGRGAVLPMTVIYCFLHFGKPAGEAISSIFGGFILGIVAYETRSIWGGVIVHMGIAWMMEIVAFLRKSVEN